MIGGRGSEPTASGGVDGSSAAQVRARPPEYLDEMIADFRSDGEGRYNHLGHWDRPDDDPLSISRAQAQQRMNDVVVALAEVGDGSRVLDVGCGFGGTLAAIDRTFDRVELTGLDVDARQLAITSRLVPRPTNQLRWVNGDGCALPFADASFDHVTSIEAMWHFPSRTAFLAEVGRVLRPGGRLAVVDILISADAPERLGRSMDQIMTTLDPGFAPWPAPTDDLEAVVDAASAAGLVCTATVDATANTTPTYLDHGDGHELPDSATFSSTAAVQFFVEMHLTKCLSVVYLGFERPSTTVRNSA